MAAVTLHLSAPSARIFTEKRFERDVPTALLRHKLEMITGIPPAAQRLALLPVGASAEAPWTQVIMAETTPLDDDLCILDAWQARDGMQLRVHDTRNVTWDVDDETVEKFELTDEQYAARHDTLRAFKQAHQLGRFAPSSATAAPGPTYEPPTPDMVVGARCEVDTGDGFPRRGTIQYVGNTKFAAGPWIGVAYDEPVGKNDGSVYGVRYFTTRARYGGFVRPAHVQVGDYAEEEWEV